MIYIKNFIDSKELREIGNVHNAPDKYFDDAGVHDSKLTSTQQWLSPQDELFKTIQDKVIAVPEFQNNKIDGVQVLTAIKPYDIHTDYIVQKNQVPISNPSINMPTYTVIIPISDGYSTVVFDQSASYNNFSTYKQENKQLEQYCTDEEWQKHCSHCHSEDQKYLTIKKIFEWKQGTLFAFDRSLFHCSSNFEKTKQAIVLWLSK